MRSTRSTIAALSACAVLAGCSSAPVDSAPVVRIAEAAKPSVSRPLDQVLPTGDELTATLGTARLHGPARRGRCRHAAAGRRRIRGDAHRVRERRLPAAEGRLSGQPGARGGQPIVGRRRLQTARRCPGSSGRSSSRPPTTPRRSSPRRPTSGGGATARRWCCTNPNTAPMGRAGSPMSWSTTG